MLLHFRDKPWDLYATLSYTVVISGTLLLLNTGNILAILLVLFVPGYVLVAALFPDSREIGWVDRVSLSIGLSIAVVPFLGLALNFTALGIRFASAIAAIALFVVFVTAAAWWRRMRLPPQDRLSATIHLMWPAWKDQTPIDKTLVIALATSIAITAGALATSFAIHRSSEGFTEFYLLGADGTASSYPSFLNVSRPGTVIIGIANHEATNVNYTVRVDLIGVQTVYNATSGFNETFEVNRTTWSTINVTLDDGRNWTQPYTFSIPYVGLWKVQFVLFKEGDFPSAYRELHLFIRVT